MDAIVFRSVLYSLAPVAGMIVGGLAAAWWNPGGRVRSYIQHFAAGVVFAAVGVETLPDVMHRQSPLAAGIGFAIGVSAMLGIRWLSRRAESASQRPVGGRTAWALLAAVGVDVFVDGMLIGVGFAAGQRQGALLAFSLTGCTVSLGLATAAALLNSGASQSAAAMLTAGLAFVTAFGAALGAIVAAQLTNAWMEGLLSFACAALLYLVTEELLAEAHGVEQRPETAPVTATFFIGFLVLLVVNMLM